MSSTGPDVPPVVTATPISTTWGNKVQADLAELWATKANQLAYVVVKSTQPTAADYGLGSIPIGAVWIQSP